MPLDTTWGSLAAVPVGLLSGVIAWLVIHPLAVGEARLAETLLRPTDKERLARRVAELTTSRTETVDARAAELRRIERDLHDGAQARLIALSMSIGMAQEIVHTDPDAAAALLAEARGSAGAALTELRDRTPSPDGTVQRHVGEKVSVQFRRVHMEKKEATHDNGRRTAARLSGGGH